MTTRTAQRAGVRTRGRAAIAARTLRTDRWWAYPLTTFSVLLAFVAYATYAALANRGHAELDMHALDARDRREVLRDRQGLGLCNITKCHTEVRPAGIKITDNAIIPMKERSADERYDPLGRVLRSWRRREDPRQAENHIGLKEAPRLTGRDRTGKKDMAMRVDYPKLFPDRLRAMAELERAVRSATLEPELLELVQEAAALTFAIVAINGWNRLAVGLRSDVLSLDGLDLPDDASGSA